MKLHSLSFALGLLFGGLGIFLFGNGFGDDEGEDRRGGEKQVQRSGRFPGGGGSERSGGNRSPVPGTEDGLLAFLKEGRKRDGNEGRNYLTDLRFFHEIASMGESEVKGVIEQICSLEEELGGDDHTGIAKGYAFMRWCELNGPEAMEAASEEEKSVEGLLALADLTREEHGKARRKIIGDLAYRNPRAAGKWTEALAEGEQRDGLMKSVATQWIEKEPEVGADWYEANLNEETRSAGLVHIFENWSRKDSTRAAEWLLKQSDDSSRDLAEAAAARAMAGQGEYHEAVSWLKAIEDAESRRENWKTLLRSHRNRTTGALPDELVEAAEAAGLETGL